MINNYNTSSTGIDIELSVSYNGDMARWNWEENFLSCSNSIYIYTNYENLKIDSFEELFESNELTTEESLLELVNSKFDEEAEDCSFTELLDWYVFPTDILELVEDLEEYKVKHTRLYQTTSSTGYSQGNCSEVLVPTKLRELWGLDDDKDLIGKDLKTLIDNYFWDYPYSIRGTVNDVEWYSESLDGQYKGYDKDTVIKEILESFKEDVDVKVLESELQDLVPNEPKYED